MWSIYLAIVIGTQQGLRTSVVRPFFTFWIFLKILFVLFLDPSTTKSLLHAHVWKMRFSSNAIISLNVVFNLDLLIYTSMLSCFGKTLLIISFEPSMIDCHFLDLKRYFVYCFLVLIVHWRLINLMYFRQIVQSFYLI